ncbi:hypothetical protein SPRG_11669 [Saprolegnia parasitica CBS 223.65]|uniref:Uncharacterized protein n=1 Tax=Saprolegnia parasitica (strain CBS 223.65) TaxID=695850 RepID=A0A067C7E8_SAPPC|nr:hypothetical protein SPRG_11669 [Saprolegnia parasitica CBS 223.65]KDO22486.1 hypothetical protein SPRG_11669 [Saprolegnia parasitica CBS 223.65]|eukprot:XP_012206734.1 hypothetical protein SPRG_11669 [Saprolegnia parasitica CBS 223.65]
MPLGDRKRKARAVQKASATPKEKAARVGKQRFSQATVRSDKTATKTLKEDTARLERRPERGRAVGSDMWPQRFWTRKRLTSRRS